MSSDSDDPFADPSVWQVTVELSPIGICVVGPDGAMWRPNPAFCRMVGHPADRLRRMRFHDVTHPDDVADDAQLFADTLQGRRASYRIVKRFLHADGGVVWGDLSATLVSAADGTPRFFVGQVLDVTAREEARIAATEAVRVAERERRLSEAVLDTVDVGLLLLDEEGRPERVNRRQQTISALAYADDPRRAEHGDLDTDPHVYGADGRTPLAEEDRPTSRATRGEEFDDARIWVGRDLATRRALSVSSRSVRGSAGRREGAALAYSDVTELVQALKAREAFERSVSHELRTPLTSVLGHLELLLESEHLSAADATAVEAVHRNAVRLQYLVGDLLDPAARGEPLDLQLTRVDLTAVVREVLDTKWAGAGPTSTPLRLASPGAVHATADAERIRQVVENLVSNALKYTDPDGSVDIEVAGEGEWARIAVNDTGIGIAAEDLGRLHEPFFRSEDARRRVAPGIGLGLGIAHTIVAAHGGRLEVSSVVGDGSQFTVHLPLGGPCPS